MPVLPETTFR